jgi:hypothetical protein
MKITINHYETYSEAVLENIPADFTNEQQEKLMEELNIDILVF